MSHNEFILKLRAAADPSDQDGIRRLRNTLKAMLRRYGWRCVEVRRADDHLPPRLGSPADLHPDRE